MHEYIVEAAAAAKPGKELFEDVLRVAPERITASLAARTIGDALQHSS